MYLALKNAFSKLINTTEEDWKAFEAILEVKTLKKKEYLLKQGQISRGVFFLSKGCLRTFHINEKGKDTSASFYFPNDFLREIESVTNNIPSQKSIQALEDSIVFYIDKSKLKNLYETSSFYQKLGRIILEKLTISEQKYASLLASHSPKERYLYILKNHPEFIERIPLQHLASYIGISRESLSRIRQKVK